MSLVQSTDFDVLFFVWVWTERLTSRLDVQFVSVPVLDMCEEMSGRVCHCEVCEGWVVYKRFFVDILLDSRLTLEDCLVILHFTVFVMKVECVTVLCVCVLTQVHIQKRHQNRT